MQSEYAIEMRNVSRRFGSIKALEDVSFTVRPGEVMALLGENGAGKSTAVRILSGFDTSYTGDIVRNGEAVRFKSPADAVRRGVAIAQQELSQVATMSVAENVFLGNTDQPNWSRIATLAKKARRFLDTVGLGDVDPRAGISTLSVGERHLVEVARLLSRHPDVLIFDEPTAALGQAESNRILEIVVKLARVEGKAIVYVSHRLDEIFAATDRLTVLRDGHSQPPVNTGDISISALMERMLGRSLGNMYPPPARLSSEPPLLVVEGLRARGLVEPISIGVRAGEILGLAGQLGSGAGAFLAAIAGAMPRLQGSVKLNGAEISPRNMRDAKRAGIAYSSSDRKYDGLFLGLPVVQNLSAPALHQISRFGIIMPSLERRHGRAVAKDMTIRADRLNSRVRTLSGGNQQKVALGKWISISPRVLLIDEPTRGVDVGARAEIYARIRDLANDGLAVIVASTDLQEIAGFPDRVATFYRGRLIETFVVEGDVTDRILRDITRPDELALGRVAAHGH